MKIYLFSTFSFRRKSHSHNEADLLPDRLRPSFSSYLAVRKKLMTSVERYRRQGAPA